MTITSIVSNLSVAEEPTLCFSILSFRLSNFSEPHAVYGWLFVSSSRCRCRCQDIVLQVLSSQRSIDFRWCSQSSSDSTDQKHQNDRTREQVSRHKPQLRLSIWSHFESVILCSSFGCSLVKWFSLLSCSETYVCLRQIAIKNGWKSSHSWIISYFPWQLHSQRGQLCPDGDGVALLDKQQLYLESHWCWKPRNFRLHSRTWHWAHVWTAHFMPSRRRTCSYRLHSTLLERTLRVGQQSSRRSSQSLWSNADAKRATETDQTSVWNSSASSSTCDLPSKLPSSFQTKVGVVRLGWCIQFSSNKAHAGCKQVYRRRLGILRQGVRPSSWGWVCGKNVRKGYSLQHLLQSCSVQESLWWRLIYCPCIAKTRQQLLNQHNQVKVAL